MFRFDDDWLPKLPDYDIIWALDHQSGSIRPTIRFRGNHVAASKGTLTIEVKKGVELPSSGIGTPSPFVEFTIGANVQRITTARKGGTSPSWNSASVQFELLGGEKLITMKAIYEHRFNLKNERIGGAKLPLGPLLASMLPTATLEQTHEAWFSLAAKKGGPGGRLFVRFSFLPSSPSAATPVTQSLPFSLPVESESPTEVQFHTSEPTGALPDS